MTWNGKKRYCPKGHPYFGPNLYVTPSTGHRVCRACRTANKEKNRLRRVNTHREEAKRLERELKKLTDAAFRANEGNWKLPGAFLVHVDGKYPGGKPC